MEAVGHGHDLLLCAATALYPQNAELFAPQNEDMIQNLKCQLYGKK